MIRIFVTFASIRSEYKPIAVSCGNYSYTVNEHRKPAKVRNTIIVENYLKKMKMYIIYGTLGFILFCTL